MNPLSPVSPAHSSPLRRVTTSVLKSLSFLILFAALLAFIALAIIYPLWFLATHYTMAFTIGIAISCAALLLLLFLFRFWKAVRNSRLDLFFTRIFHLVFLVLFFAIQVLFSLVNICYLDLVMMQGVESIPAIVVMIMGCCLAFPCLVLVMRAKRLFLSPIWFVIMLILSVFHLLYWAAVFFARSLFLPAVILLLIIFSFFFFEKITKIEREKKKPHEESIRP